METNNRFRSTIKSVIAFKDVINVHCPNCNEKASLHRKVGAYRSYGDHYEFKCDNVSLDFFGSFFHQWKK